MSEAAVETAETTPEPQAPAAPEPVAAPSITEPPAESTPEPVAAQTSWRDAIDEDLRQAPELANYKTLSDAAKGLIETKKKVREKGIIPPKEGAPPEEVEAFYKELGRPDTPEGYDLTDFEPPEGLPWDTGFQSEALKALHENGAPQGLARNMVEWYANKQAEAVQEFAARSVEVEKGWETEVKTKWGSAHPQRTDMAQRAFRASFGDEVGEAIAAAQLPGGGRLGNHPAFLDTMSKIGEMMSESGLLGEKAPTRHAKTPEQATAELGQLKKDSEFLEAWQNKAHPGHEDAVARWNLLHQQQNPPDAA